MGKAKSARDFAAQMVTPVRCHQGVDEACGGSVEMKRMGAFLKWVGRDVQKEGVAELETAGLEWKDVKRGGQRRGQAVVCAGRAERHLVTRAGPIQLCRARCWK